MISSGLTRFNEQVLAAQSNNPDGYGRRNSGYTSSNGASSKNLVSW